MKFLLLTVLSAFAIASSSACHCNPEPDDPVCGTDGKTYKNSCVFVCQNRPGAAPAPPAHILHKGNCKSDAPCDCPMYHEAVCGSDSMTWPNSCLLECAKSHAEGEFENRKDLKVEKTGTCGFECDCKGKEVDLKCGSDNVTYKNGCVIDCVTDTPYGKFLHLAVKKDGAC